MYKAVGFSSLIVVIILVSGALQPTGALAEEDAVAQLFAYTDTEFNLADWEAVVLVDHAGRHSMTRKESGGNPGAYLEIVHQAPKPTDPYPPVGFIIGYFNTAAAYDPAVFGPFTSLDVTVDNYLYDNSFAIYENIGIAIRQDGNVFYALYGGLYAGNGRPYWFPLGLNFLTPSDFFEYPNRTGAELDLSPAGGPIEFGFVWESTTDIYQFEASGSPRKTFALDNFAISAVTQAPIQAEFDLQVNGGSEEEVVYVNQVGSEFSVEAADGYTVTNNGPDTAENVLLNVDFSAPSGSVPLNTRSLDQVSCSSQSQSCDLGDLEAGQSETVMPRQTYGLDVESESYLGTASLITRASADGLDSDPSNNASYYRAELFDCEIGFIREVCPVFFLFCSSNFGVGESRQLAQETAERSWFQGASQMIDASQVVLDILIFYDIRDEVMANRADGKRYSDLYNTHSAEILQLIRSDQGLFGEALETLQMWEPNLKSLIVDGGSGEITQAQIDQMDSFLTQLAAAGSPDLQGVIEAEREVLGELDTYVGRPMWSVAETVLGPSTAMFASGDAFLPFIYEEE
ncbi:MAG: hypothetical protein AAF633_00950 [Chloroflexota bacterium]